MSGCGFAVLIGASAGMAVTGSSRGTVSAVPTFALLTTGGAGSGVTEASGKGSIASASTSRAYDFKSRFPHKEALPLRARLFLYSTTTVRFGFFILE
jgi:hypothetical protein